MTLTYRPHLLAVAGLSAAAALTLTACGTADTDADATPTELVLVTPDAPGEYNPVDGYGELGVSPLFDGLLMLESDGDNDLPEFVPALAAGVPVPNEDQTVWEVLVRADVTFSNGDQLTADDVVATYSALLDPAVASQVAGPYSMIDTVEADGDRVRFILAYPYADFPSRLTLGILPASAIEDGPAAAWAVNTEPIGTGPYVLESMTPSEAVLTVRDDYWGDTPPIERLVLTTVDDDNTRAQRMQAGAADGTVLPPQLADTFTDRDGYTVTTVQTADWRAVSFPADNALAQDPQARLAMNIAVDRQGMVDDVLAGNGVAAHTPFPQVYGDSFNDDAVFAHDPEAAAQILDDAGWEPGDDGIRVKDGQRAELPVYYSAGDNLRRDLAAAFAADMAPLGIKVDLRGTSWDEIEAESDTAGVLLAGGDKPHSIDTQVYETLHSRTDDSPRLSNIADFQIDGVDEALEQARRSLDPAERAELYRQVQDLYVGDPTHVFLAFVDHTYVAADNGWNTGPTVIEPHAHGVTWGPWWNLAAWTEQ